MDIKAIVRAHKCVPDININIMLKYDEYAVYIIYTNHTKVKGKPRKEEKE